MKPNLIRGISSQLRFILAVVLSIALIFGNNYLSPLRQSLASLLSPLQYLANVPGEALDHFSEYLQSRDQLALQNKELLRQQLLISERLQRFEYLRQENDRLRDLLGSPLHLDARKTVAEVVEVASDPHHQYVVLDHGSMDGVFVGQSVVDAYGVVGQVIEVTPLTSRVLLISDVNHAVPVRISRNDIRLIAKGTGDLDEIELQHVAKSTDIKAGDLLMTSGLGNRFPEGYPVARVHSVRDEDGKNYATALAKPLAALDRIRYVLLVWPTPTPNSPALDAESTAELESKQETVTSVIMTEESQS